MEFAEEKAKPFSASKKSLIISLQGDNIYLLDKIRPYIIQNTGEDKVVVKYNDTVIETSYYTDASDKLVNSINTVIGDNCAQIQ